MWFQEQTLLKVAINNIIRRESLTKEAVDDPEEAAHGANDRGHDLVSPLDLLVAPQHLLAQAQQLAGGRHGDPRFGGGEDDQEGGKVGATLRMEDWISGSRPFKRVYLQRGGRERGSTMGKRESEREREETMEGKVIIDFLLQVLT